jgi:hypothetical protein
VASSRVCAGSPVGGLPVSHRDVFRGCKRQTLMNLADKKLFLNGGNVILTLNEIKPRNFLFIVVAGAGFGTCCIHKQCCVLE